MENLIFLRKPWLGPGFISKMVPATNTVAPRTEAPTRSWALYLFWFLSWTCLQGSFGVIISSMLGLFQFSRAETSLKMKIKK